MLHGGAGGAGRASTEREDIAFVAQLEKIQPAIPDQGRTRGNRQSWDAYYSPGAREYVRERERQLLAIFPEFDERRTESR